MKISKAEFAKALNESLENMKGDNYRANMEHNAGRWNYWNITRVVIDGVTFYCAPCCKTANSNIAVIKRVCASH